MGKKYNVIYADPPWSYDNKKTGRNMEYGAEHNYSTMTMQDISLLPVNEITEDNALCFIWVTVPLLPEGLETLKSWGFTYKTMLTWDKEKFGMGFWFRGQTEHLVMGVKGKVKPFRSHVRNILRLKLGEHSQKPQYFRDVITDLCTRSFDEPKKLELFARSRAGFFPDYEYEGWDVYGNQVNNSISI